MRCVRGEPLQLVKRTLQARKRLVESPCQQAEFVVRVLHVDTRAQSLGADFASTERHPLHWAECTPREVIASEPRQAERQGQPDQKTQRELPETLPHWVFAKSHA